MATRDPFYEDIVGPLIATIPPPLAKKKRPLTRKEHALLILAVDRLHSFIYINGWRGLPATERAGLDRLTGTGHNQGVTAQDLDKLSAQLRNSFHHDDE